MKKSICHLCLLVILVVFFQSCDNKNKQLDFNKKELVDYFETDDIEIKTNVANRVEITVKNSSLLTKEQQKKGDKWTTAEAFSSIGALIFSTQVQSLTTDSIVVNMETKGATEHYSYLLNDLNKIRTYVDTCIEFSKLIGRKDYSSAKKLLAKDILDKTDKVQLDNFLTTIFLQRAVIKSVLIAFKIQDGVAGLYMNVYYDNDEAQTYIFSFRMNGDGRIGGIRTPE